MDTSKLKPFDLQKALAGEQVCLENGIVITPENVTSGGWQISIRLGDTKPALFYEPRYNTIGSTEWFDLDRLFMAPRTREVWVNLYPHRMLNGQSVCIFEDAPDEEYANLKHDAIIAATGGPVSKPIDRLGNCAHKITITE